MQETVDYNNTLYFTIQIDSGCYGFSVFIPVIRFRFLPFVVFTRLPYETSDSAARIAAAHYLNGG